MDPPLPELLAAFPAPPELPAAFIPLTFVPPSRLVTAFEWLAPHDAEEINKNSLGSGEGEDRMRCITALLG
jgi:hypothetical protein